jgi:hypothetical protein
MDAPDATLILRAGLTHAERTRLVHDVMAMVESDIRKGVDGGGCVFVARLSRE